MKTETGALRNYGLVYRLIAYDSGSLAPLGLALTLFVPVLVINLLTSDSGQYQILAESLISGRLDFMSQPLTGWDNTAVFNGRHYWPLGVLPAILGMPFMNLGWYTQSRFNLVACCLIFYLCVRLARRFKYSTADALWLAIAVCFATSFIGVAIWPLSWYMAHVIAVLFLFLALNELEGSRRAWLIGLCVGLAMASRPFAGATILFFLAVLNWRDRLAAAIPFCAIGLALAAYNYARFGNPLEFGYKYQLMHSGEMFAATMPTFSLRYIPGNLWSFLFALPDSRGLVTSAVLMSPYLIWLLARVKWNRTAKIAAANVALILVALLSFRNVGFFQIGYRFSLDFLPLLFWAVMRSRVELTRTMKAAISASALLDMAIAFHFIVTADTRVMPPGLG